MDMQRVPVREAFYEARFIGNRCYMPPVQKYRVYSDSVKRLPPSTVQPRTRRCFARDFQLWLLALAGCERLLGRRLRAVTLALRKRADCDIVPVWVSQRELLGSSVGVDVRIFLELCDKSARPMQRRVEIVDTKEQE